MAIANRQPLPEAIANAPTLYLGLDFYFRAFLDLNTCRDMGMGRGPLPWTALVQYAGEMGLTGEDKEDFLYLLQKVDNDYLEWARDQDKKNRPKKGR